MYEYYIILSRYIMALTNKRDKGKTVANKWKAKYSLFPMYSRVRSMLTVRPTLHQKCTNRRDSDCIYCIIT